MRRKSQNSSASLGASLSPAAARAWFIFITLAAVALRAWRWLSADLAHDAANCGLMGQTFLRGDFPVFYLGSPYQGSLDAVPTALFLWLFGNGSLALNLTPAVLGLAFCLVAYLALRRLASPLGALLGYAFLALPGGLLLYWAGEARNHYPMPLLLCALLIWNTLILAEAPKRRLCWAGLWGLWAGAAFWCNFLSAVMILPAGVVLILLWWRRGLAGGLAAALAGALVGASPLLFYLTRFGMPTVAKAGKSGLSAAWDRLGDLFGNALPVALGVNPPAGGLAGHPWFLAWALAAGLLMLWGCWLLWRRFRQSGNPAYLLPLGILLVNPLVVAASQNGNLLWHQDQRYFLPMLPALAFCLAALADWLAGRKRALALGLAALVLAGNAASLATWRPLAYDDFWGGGPLLGLETGYYFRRETRDKEIIRRAGRLGIKAMYVARDYGTEQRTAFLAGDHPVTSQLYNEELAHSAALVDAALAPAFWASLAGSARMLGLPFRQSGDDLFFGFRAGPAGRLLPRQDWRASAATGRDLGRALGDGDLSTGYISSPKAGPGEGFLLDLGRVEQIGGLALFPSQYQEMPKGLLIEAAGEDRVFRPARGVGDYWGPFYLSGPHPVLKARNPRIEAYFNPPLTARYLRFGHLGRADRPFTVQEVLAFGPGRGPAVDWPATRQELARAARRAKAQSALADAWPAAVLKLALGPRFPVLLANLKTNDYGSIEPRPFPPPLLRAGRGQALVVRQRAQGEALRLLKEAGVAVRAYPAGAYSLLLLGRRELGREISDFKTSSTRGTELAAGLARGLAAGRRWNTGRPQGPADELRLDLGKPRDLRFLELAAPDFPLDFARGLSAMVSLDGKAWRPARLKQVWPLAFSGRLPALFPGPVNLYRLSGDQPLRYLRLAPAAPHPVWWWSLQRVRAWEADRGQ